MTRLKPAATAILASLNIVRRPAGDLSVEMIDLEAFSFIELRGLLFVIAGEDAGTLIYQPPPQLARLEFGASGGTIIRVEWNDRRQAALDALRTRLADHAAIGARMRNILSRTDKWAPLALRSAALHLVSRAFHASEKKVRPELVESPSAALRSARIETAIAQLIESSRSVAQVATSCGFYDASHLARSLYAATGLRAADLRSFR